MKIQRTFTTDEIVEIISKDTGISKEDLYLEENLEFLLDGFSIAVDYFSPQMEEAKFNNIWN